MARRRIACDPARRVRYRPSPDTASRRVITYRIARRRIACRMARRGIASRCVPARVGDLGVPTMFTVGHPEGPSSAMSRPNSACSRRRHRRFTNIYSFAWPSRFSMARSAARLRRTVGPLAARKAVAGRTGSSDITGNNRPSSGHFRASSGHRPGIVRASSRHRPGIVQASSGHRPGIVQASSRHRGSSCAVSSIAGHAVPSGPSRRDSPSPDRVRSGSSRAVSPVAGHGVENGHRVRYDPSPDRVP